MPKRTSLYLNVNPHKKQKTQMGMKHVLSKETKTKARKKRTECAQGHVCPCLLWRLGAPLHHPHLPTPVTLNGLLCYRKQWRTDNMTSNTCVTHPPLDGGNSRWRENKGRSLWFMHLGLTRAGIYLLVTWYKICCCWMLTVGFAYFNLTEILSFVNTIAGKTAATLGTTQFWKLVF